MKHIFSLLIVAVSVATSSLAGVAMAQGYPTKPITIVVPFSAGAGTDLIARTLAEKLSARVGQPVLVENKVGAAGVLGTNLVAKASADGYTLLFTPGSFSFAQQVVKSSGGYDPLNDFAPIVEVGSTPMFLVTGSGTGIKSFKEALAASKAKSMAYGSAGTGSILHIVGELVNKETGINLVHVPYKGVAPAVSDVLGGHIPFAYGSLSTIKPHLASGKLVPLAITGRERTSLAPDVPTLYELGYKGVNLNSWYGVFAPKGMPPEQVKLLNEHFNAILKMPDVIERMAVQGATPVGGAPDVLAKTNRDDVQAVGKIIADVGIKAD